MNIVPFPCLCTYSLHLHVPLNWKSQERVVLTLLWQSGWSWWHQPQSCAAQLCLIRNQSFKLHKVLTLSRTFCLVPVHKNISPNYFQWPQASCADLTSHEDTGENNPPQWLLFIVLSSFILVVICLLCVAVSFTFPVTFMLSVPVFPSVPHAPDYPFVYLSV